MAEDTQALEKKEAQYSGDMVEVQVERKPKCRVEFLVKASPKLTAQAQKNAIKHVAKHVSLPGFRKGRAPENLVFKKFPNDVDKKWQEVIADLAFKESAKLTNIPILSGNAKITFHMKRHSLNEGAELTLNFETNPVVPEIDPKKIELTTVEKPEVNEEKYNTTIEQIRQFFATWEKITDREIREGDHVIVDLEDLEQSPPQKIFSKTRLSVHKEKMAEWMYKLVIGKEIGKSYDGTSKPDASLPEEEKKQYPEKKVRLTIHEVTNPILPEVDQGFAERLGVKTTDEMRENIMKMLQSHADKHVEDKLREQVSEALLSTFPFELPESLIEREANFRLKELAQDEKFKQHWGTLSEQDRKATVQQIYEQSEKAVRIFYLCRKVIDENKLTVSPDDLPPPPQTPIEALLSPYNNRQPHHAHDTQSAEAYSRMIMEKAETFIANNATLVKEKKVPAAKEEKPAPAEKEKKAAPKNKAAPKKKTESAEEKEPKKAAPKKKAESTEPKKRAPAKKKAATSPDKKETKPAAKKPAAKKASPAKKKDKTA